MQRQCVVRVLGVMLAATWLWGAPVRAAELDIEPLPQLTPVWCWAATAEMVLTHFGVGNLNPAGIYQCGVVGVLGGVCAYNCSLCQVGIGSMQNFRQALNAYVGVARSVGAYSGPDLNPKITGSLSITDLEEYIEDDIPVIAGISPAGLLFPDGVGISQHVVVIIGADSSTGDLIVNDPYPYPPGADPYIYHGGHKIKGGQYEIGYESFQMLKYQNSLVLE